MPLNFPTSPSLNDTYTFNNKTWIWNGNAWAINNTGAINGIPIGNTNPSTGNFTSLAASSLTLSGNIIPTANITYDIGTSANRFKDIWLSNSTIYIGAASITTDGGNLVLTNPDGGQSVVSGNQTVSSNTLVEANSNLAVSNNYISLSVNSNANVLLVTASGANITGTVNISGNANVGNLGATGLVATTISGSLTTNAQPNITSVGTLSSVSATGNITGGNLTTGGVLSVTGNANVGNIGASGGVFTTISGSLLTASQPNITSVGTLSGLAIGGNIIPNANVTYDLGNSTNRFKDIYLSNSTIYLGNTTLSATGDDFTITGNLSANNANLGNSAIANYVTGTLMTNAQPHVTSLGTLTGLSLTGNLTSTANIYANSFTIGASLLTGTITTNSQPNITAVGTLGNLSITNNLTVGGNFTVTGNLVYANVSDLVVNDPLIYLASNNVGDTDDIGLVANWDDGVYQHGGMARDHTDGTWKFFSNVVAEPTTTIDWANAVYDPVKAGSLTVVANANVGNIGASAGVFTGNVSANYITATQLISNVNVGTAPIIVSSSTKVANLNADYINGYSTDQSVSANTVVVRDANGNILGNNITGTLVTSSQTNITSLGTLGSLAVSANITSGNIYANSGTIGASLVTGTLTTASQPNVTSLGTLTTLNVSGVANLNAVGNLRISGGSNGQILTSNGSGGVSFETNTGISTGKAIAMSIVFGG